MNPKSYLAPVLTALLAPLFSSELMAQCSISSTCGYSTTISIQPIAIEPSSASCPWGYNYNVRFSYTLVVSGSNSCYNASIGYQPQISCDGQSNDYYTIYAPAPPTGGGTVNNVYSGTLVTTSNPYRSNSDCASATPQLLNCNSMQLTIFGPGIPTSTYPCSFSTLPVTLLQFSAVYHPDGVQLNWSTAAEKNNLYFEVQRSTNGSTWETIDKRFGAGNQAGIRHYQSEDKLFAPGINYYRLRQTDVDGTYSYSEIQMVNAGPQLEITLSPNPFSGSLLLKTSDPGSYQVKNQMGQTVSSGDCHLQTNLFLVDQPAGVYFLEFKTARGFIIAKLLKQ